MYVYIYIYIYMNGARESDIHTIHTYMHISTYHTSIQHYIKDGQTYPKRFLPELNKTQ